MASNPVPPRSIPGPARIAVFGELLLRLDPPGYERVRQARTFTVRYTGAEANTAAALAQWGHRCSVLSRVPAHELGDACLDQIRTLGLDVSGVLRGGERLGIVYIETGAAQRPSTVIYDRGHSAFRDIDATSLDWAAALAGCDWLHLSGTAPALGAGVRAALMAGLDAARRQGVRVSLDVNYRSTLWSLAEARAVLPGILAQVDVCIGTHHDARALLDIDAEPAESAQRLRQRFGFSQVAYTLRDSASASDNRFGGLLCDAQGVHRSRDYDMHLVDRIGGGDAFSAGLIHGLLRGWDGQRSVDFAAAGGCLKHSIPGDVLIASEAEIAQLAAEGGSGRVRR